jgi:hypothetical protein
MPSLRRRKVVGVVDEMLLGGVRPENLRFSVGQRRPDLHAVEFGRPPRQHLIEQPRETQRVAIVHPHPGVDEPGCLFGTYQLPAVFAPVVYARSLADVVSRTYSTSMATAAVQSRLRRLPGQDRVGETVGDVHRALRPFLLTASPGVPCPWGSHAVRRIVYNAARSGRRPVARRGPVKYT